MKRFWTLVTLAALCLTLLAGCGKEAPAVTAESEMQSESGMKLTQESNVSKEKYLKESDFEEFLSLSEPQFIIPGLKQATVPQGMAYCEKTGLIYISAYYTIDVPSVISAVKADSGELSAEYFLYNEDGSIFQSHVGGVAVCGDTLYVSAKLDNDGSYSVAAIPLSVLPTEGSHDVTVHDTVSLPVSPSFLNCSGGYLWAGNFYYPKGDYDLSPEINYTTEECGCYIVGYKEDRDLLSEGGTYPVPDVILAVTDRIQGFNIMSDGSALLSQSYGRKNNSALLRYELDMTAAPDAEIELLGVKVPCFVLSEDELMNDITAMPMTEGLCTAPDGSTLVLFESGAMRYEDGLFRTDKVWKIDF